MPTMRTPVLAVLLALVLSAVAVAEFAPIAPTRTFLEEHPDVKPLIEQERLIALYGGTLATNTTEQSADDFVQSFIDVNADALGVENVVLDYRDKITIKNGAMAVYTYIQKIDGLPVHGSVVRLPVHLDPDPSKHKIVYAGTHLVPLSALPPPPGTPAQDAIDEVLAMPQFTHLTMDSAEEAHKVIYEAPDSTLHRVWRFNGWAHMEAYRFFVDTDDLALVGTDDLIYELGDVTGTIKAWATPCCPDGDLGCCADGAPGTCPADAQPCCAADDPDFCETCPRETVLRGIRVQLNDGTTTYTDENGQYTFTGLDETPVTVSAQLVGRCGGVAQDLACVTVENDAGTNTMVSGNVTPADPPAGLNLSFGSGIACGDSGREFTTAQLNAYIALQKTHDWFKGLQPTFTGIDTNATAFVNLDQCAGNFSGIDASALFGKAGCTFGGVSQALTNSAILTVVSHEYGHFIVDEVIVDRQVDFYTQGFHEGASDTIAGLLWNTSGLGFGWCEPDDPATSRGFIRNFDDPDMPLDACVDAPGCNSPCSADTGPCGTAHCRGRALVGAFWDLRKLMLQCEGGSNDGSACHPDADCPGGQCTLDGLCADGSNDGGTCNVHSACTGGGLCIDDRDVERLFADFMFVTDGRLDQSVLPEVLIADDDDGNRSNGTPNETLIKSVFVGTGTDQHGWDDSEDCGAPAGENVIVKWAGPTRAPEAGTDYTVDYFIRDGACVPHITLRVTEASDDPLPVITRWDIGRTVNDIPADIGAVFADWEGTPQDIEVRIGFPEFNTPVNNVNVVEVPRQSETNYSSLVTFLGGWCDSTDPNEDGLRCGTGVDETPCASGTCSVGHLTGRAQCFARVTGSCDGGTLNGQPCSSEDDCPGGTCAGLHAGGRISGSITGSAGRVFGRAIGQGAANLGRLRVDGVLDKTRFASVPLDTGSAEPELDAGGLSEMLEITGPLEGRVAIGAGGALRGRCYPRDIVACDTDADCAAAETDPETDDNVAPPHRCRRGGVQIGGSVESGSGITLAGAVSGEIVIGGELLSALVLENTAPPVPGFGGSVEIQGSGASTGDILIHGDMLGYARRCSGGGDTIEGTVCSSDSDCNGGVCVGRTGASIATSGPMAGDITLDADQDGIGSMAAGTSIDIDAELTGTISAVDIAGSIAIGQPGDTDTTSTGNITAASAILATAFIDVRTGMSGDIVATGDILGSVRVEGPFTGDICGANLQGTGGAIPDGLDITINFAHGGTICGEPAIAQPPLRPDPEFVKNRHLSFIPTNTGEPTALRVTLHDGETRWLEAPFDRCENSGQSAPPAEGCPQAPGLPRTLRVATLGCSPVYIDWGSEGLVHVFGSEIQPDKSYTVQAIRDGEANFSAPLTIDTSLWADSVSDCATDPCGPPNSVVDIQDILAQLDKFSNLKGAPSKARVDIHPEIPDGIVAIGEVTTTLDAFAGAAYPFPCNDCGPCP